MKQLPKVDQVRPTRCPGCRAPSRRPGCRLELQGHGVVRRDIWGLLSLGSTPAFDELILRRYRCLRCGTVIRVGPRGLLPYRRYTGGSIAFALALWSIFGHPAGAIREQLSPWRPFAGESRDRWVSLARWAESARQGRLWRLRLRWAPQIAPRTAAAFVVRALVARQAASTLGPLQSEQIFAAGLQAQRVGSS